MFNDGVLDALATIFDKTWQLFQIDFPGTNVRISTIMIGSMVVVLSLKVLGVVTGFSFVDKDFFNPFDRPAGNNKSIMIVPERRNDRF